MTERRTDTLTGLKQSFGSKNVQGIGGSVLNVNSGYVLNDGNGGANYDVTLVPASGTITPATLSITGVQASGKIYDGTRVASLSGGAIEVFGRDDVALVNTGVVGSFESKDAGTAKPVTATGYAINGADAPNYILTMPQDLKADIAPKLLTVAAKNDVRTYDGLPYTGGNGVAFSGFVAGESESVLSGVLAYGGTSQGAVSVGTYAIRPTGLSSPNYHIQWEDGQLTMLSVPASSLVSNLVRSVPVSSTSTPASLGVGSSFESANFAADKSMFSAKTLASRLMIVSPPQENAVGIARMHVNLLSADGQPLQIPLPQELSGLRQATVKIESLPPWLKFEPLRQVFKVETIPEGVEAIEVSLQLGDKTWMLTIDFRAD